MFHKRRQKGLKKNRNKFSIFNDLSFGTAYVSRQTEGKIMEESSRKGHFVRSNADILDASHKHIQDLDIEAEVRLASELEQSSKENEKGQNSREFGMRRSAKIKI